MSYKLHEKVFDKFLSKLSKDFEIWEPKRFVGKGRFNENIINFL